MELMTWQWLPPLSISYLIGSIPFGFIITRVFYQKDIRQFGSKNSGATNVWRTFGKVPGICTLLLDALKGIGVVLGAQILFPDMINLPIVCGIVAILGHNWTVFLKFKGGKGVATSAGVFLALMPAQFGVAMGVFLVSLALTKYVSVSSMLAALTLLTAGWFTNISLFLRITVSLAVLLVLVRHIPNMQRLAKGTETKVNEQH